MYCDLDVHQGLVDLILIEIKTVGADHEITVESPEQPPEAPIVSVLTMVHKPDGRKFEVTISTRELD